MVLAARLLTVARRHRPPLLSDFFPGQLDVDSALSLLIFLPLEKVVSNEGVPKKEKNNEPFLNAAKAAKIQLCLGQVF